MGTTRRRVILRSVCAVVMAMVIAGCATPSSSSGGTAASPSTQLQRRLRRAPHPRRARPLRSQCRPTASPTSPADALEAVPPIEGALNAIWIGDGSVVVGGIQRPRVQLDHPGVRALDPGRSPTCPTAPGQVTGIARLGDRLIAVGNGLPDIRNGFIWDSTDGRVWRTVQTIEDAGLCTT